MKKSHTSIINVRPVDENHQVITVTGGSGGYRRKPCSDCPWRIDATGVFPADAFKHSANTAYDMSEKTFGCHQSGNEKPATCAGFLLKGANHNLSVRLGMMTGRYKNDVRDDGLDLHQSYREMAQANGVDPDDPALEKCR